MMIALVQDLVSIIVNMKEVSKQDSRDQYADALIF